MKSIYRQDEEYFEELRDYAIAYCQYVKSGGCISNYSDSLIEKTIDVVMKIKANRDFVCGYSVQYDSKGNRIKA